MNLPIEICAIVETYLPLQFDRKTEKKIWQMARCALNKGYLSNGVRNADTHALITGLGSKHFQIAYTGTSYGRFEIESKYLEIEIQQFSPNEIHPYVGRKMIDNEFVLHMVRKEDNSTVRGAHYHFLVKIIQ